MSYSKCPCFFELFHTKFPRQQCWDSNGLIKNYREREQIQCMHIVFWNFAGAQFRLMTHLVLLHCINKNTCNPRQYCVFLILDQVPFTKNHGSFFSWLFWKASISMLCIFTQKEGPLCLKSAVLQQAYICFEYGRDVPMEHQISHPQFQLSKNPPHYANDLSAFDCSPSVVIS